jgi:hypothetical protein
VFRHVSTDAAAEGPTIYLPAAVKRLLELYIRECPLEISGVGEVWTPVAGRIVVSHLHLVEQVASRASTDLTANGLATFLGERVDTGLGPAVRLWWHSHAGAECFWSATDERTIESFAHSGWWCSIVGNHRGDLLARVDIFPSPRQPLRHTFAATVTALADEDVVKEEIARKVKGLRAISTRREP